MTKGYVSPIFLIIAGLFLVALVATAIVNTRNINVNPIAAPLVKEVELLPSESVDINCGSGGRLEVVLAKDSSYKLTCTGFLPSN